MSLTLSEAPRWTSRLFSHSSLLLSASHRLSSSVHSAAKGVLEFDLAHPLNQGGQLNLQQWGFNLTTARLVLEPFFLLSLFPSFTSFIFFFGGGAAPAADGSFQARGRIGAATASLHHRTLDPSHICDRHCSLWQQRIL